MFSGRVVFVLLFLCVLFLLVVLLLHVFGFVVIPSSRVFYRSVGVEGVYVSVSPNIAYGSEYYTSFIVSVCNSGSKPVVLYRVVSARFIYDSNVIKLYIEPTIDLPVIIEPNTTLVFHLITVLPSKPILSANTVYIEVCLDVNHTSICNTIKYKPSTFRKHSPGFTKIYLLNGTRLYRVDDYSRNKTTVYLQMVGVVKGYLDVSKITVSIDAMHTCTIKGPFPPNAKFSYVCKVVETDIDDPGWDIGTDHTVSIAYYVGSDYSNPLTDHIRLRVRK